MSIELILHPGHGKCGSSSIQSFLYSNFDELEKKGLYLPDQNFKFSFELKESPLVLRPPGGYFEKIVESETEIASFKERLNKLLDQAKQTNCQTILISSEHLSRIPPFKIVHEILASSFKIRKIIYYVRRQDEFLVSSWQEWGHKNGIDIHSYIDQALARHHPDFLGTVRVLEEIYGEDNIIVVPLNKKSFRGEDLIADFCDRTRLSITSRKSNDNREENKGLNPYLCEILSRIPSVYSNVHDKSVKKILMNYVDTKTILFAKDNKFLSKTQRDKIFKEFEDDNTVLCGKHFENLSCNDFVPSADNIVELRDDKHHEINKLKDIASIQMEIILKLLKEKQEVELKKSKIERASHRLTMIVKKIKKLIQNYCH